MTTVADRSILALHTTYEELATVVGALSQDQLAAGSGASAWSVAQVLSHLGSGAEISLATLQAAVAGTPGPDQDFNHQVWDRWNALSPPDQAANALAHDVELLAALDALTSEQRQALRIDLGFLPAPVSLATYTGMRLNEAAQHSWDVRVAFEPGAAIRTDTATLLVEHLATDLEFMLGFAGHPDALAQPVVIDVQHTAFSIVMADTISLTRDGPPPTAAFAGPVEALIRMIAGRLSPQHTPTTVVVSGDVTLDDLRRVFPGY